MSSFDIPLLSSDDRSLWRDPPPKRDVFEVGVWGGHGMSDLYGVSWEEGLDLDSFKTFQTTFKIFNYDFILKR